jgi:hypothetical protein
MLRTRSYTHLKKKRMKKEKNPPHPLKEKEVRKEEGQVSELRVCVRARESRFQGALEGGSGCLRRGLEALKRLIAVVVVAPML